MSATQSTTQGQSLIIEFTGEQVHSRPVNGTVRYSVNAYAHVGAPYPFPIRVPLAQPSHCPPAGMYYLLPSAFRAGKYGDLEVNNFDLANNLRPVPSSK